MGKALPEDAEGGKVGLPGLTGPRCDVITILCSLQLCPGTGQAPAHMQHGA